MMRLAAVIVLVALASVGAAAETTVGGDNPATVRNVTPPGITPGPKVDGPLERAPTPPRPPQWWRFFLPETTDAATFVTDGRTIHVAGVVPPPPEKMCADSGAGDWPCGRVALTNFRLFLRGRSVECYYDRGHAGSEITAPCRVGPIDVGQWLLTQGWASTADDASDDYRRDGEEARCARRGVWRTEAPPVTCTAAQAAVVNAK